MTAHHLLNAPQAKGEFYEAAAFRAKFGKSWTDIGLAPTKLRTGEDAHVLVDG